MATVSTLIDWISSATGSREIAGPAVRSDGSEFEPRSLPNEEIYLWVREVDNSHVMPKPDPKSTRACFRCIGGAMVGVMLLVGLLIPFSYNVLAGYQIHALERQHSALLREHAELELKEAELLNPARLAELAAIQQLVDPQPETSIPLEPVSKGELALNQQH